MNQLLSARATLCVTSVLLLGTLLLGCASTASSSAAERAPVKLGEPSGDIDPELIGDAVRGNPGQFQRCYEVGRERNPSLTGRVEVRFLINTDGTVGQAMVVETNLPRTLATCVVDAFYSLRLPEQKSAVIAQYPMFFQPT